MPGDPLLHVARQADVIASRGPCPRPIEDVVAHPPLHEDWRARLQRRDARLNGDCETRTPYSRCGRVGLVASDIGARRRRQASRSSRRLRRAGSQGRQGQGAAAGRRSRGLTTPRRPTRRAKRIRDAVELPDFCFVPCRIRHTRCRRRRAMNAAPVPSSSNEAGSGVCATACTVPASALASFSPMMSKLNRPGPYPTISRAL